MPDTPPKSMDIDEFPVDTSVRICVEPDCDKPCKKRGRGYAKWCEEHLFNHPNTDEKTKHKTISEPDRGRVADKAKGQVTALLAMLQIHFIMQNDRYCAWAVGETAEDIAKNFGVLAADIKWVAKMVDHGDKYFAGIMLAINVGKLALMIGVHHDWVPYTGPVKFFVPKPPAKQVDGHGTMPANLRVVVNNGAQVNASENFSNPGT